MQSHDSPRSRPDAACIPDRGFSRGRRHRHGLVGVRELPTADHSRADLRWRSHIHGRYHRICDTDRDSIIFSAVSGIGFSCILVLLVAGVQLSTPHHVIATASAVITSTRSIGAAMFTAIYTAVFSQKLSHNIPAKITAATLPEGLPQSSLGAFIGALSSHNRTALQSIPGVTGEIIQSGNEALREAYLESIKPVFIIAIPFGAIGCVCCLFLGTMRDAMTYKVDAPVEKLHAKGPRL